MQDSIFKDSELDEMKERLEALEAMQTRIQQKSRFTTQVLKSKTVYRVIKESYKVITAAALRSRLEALEHDPDT